MKKPKRRSKRRPSPALPRKRKVEKKWKEIDYYFCDNLLPDDPVLASALESSNAAGLPPIAVAPNQGKLLQLLAEMIGARSILEIGTLGGYSTIWMARALPSDGRVTTLEVDPRHAEVARGNFARAGLAKMIEIRIGSALATLPQLVREQRGPFDLVFIDADKENIPAYFDWAIKLSRPGSLIIVDNVVRDGEVVNAKTKDPSVQGVRRFVEQLRREPRVAATAIQTVGTKGYDGFAVARVR
jgi:predicted O-methyltransferase YrrM